MTDVTLQILGNIAMLVIKAVIVNWVSSQTVRSCRRLYRRPCRRVRFLPPSPNLPKWSELGQARHLFHDASFAGDLQDSKETSAL